MLAHSLKMELKAEGENGSTADNEIDVFPASDHHHDHVNKLAFVYKLSS